MTPKRLSNPTCHKWKSRAQEANRKPFLKVYVLIVPPQAPVTVPLQLDSPAVASGWVSAAEGPHSSPSASQSLREMTQSSVYQTVPASLLPSPLEPPTHGKEGCSPLSYLTNSSPPSASALWGPFVEKPLPCHPQGSQPLPFAPLFLLGFCHHNDLSIAT